MAGYALHLSSHSPAPSLSQAGPGFTCCSQRKGGGATAICVHLQQEQTRKRRQKKVVKALTQAALCLLRSPHSQEALRRSLTLPLCRKDEQKQNENDIENENENKNEAAACSVPLHPDVKVEFLDEKIGDNLSTIRRLKVLDVHSYVHDAIQTSYFRSWLQSRQIEEPL